MPVLQHSRRVNQGFSGTFIVLSEWQFLVCMSDLVRAEWQSCGALWQMYHDTWQISSRLA